MTADEILCLIVADYNKNEKKWFKHTKPDLVDALFKDAVREHGHLILDTQGMISGVITNRIRAQMLNALCALRLLDGTEFWDLHPDVLNLLAASGNKAAILMQEAHRVFNLPNERTP